MRVVKWCLRLCAVTANYSHLYEVTGYILQYGSSFSISRFTFKYTLARHSSHYMNVFFDIPQHERPKEEEKQKISLQVAYNLAAKGYTKSKEIKCKMKIWKSNGLPGLQLLNYRKPRKNILKINLLLLLAISPCFFVAVFHFLVIFSQVVWLSPHNFKNNVATFREELVKRDKSRTRLFILSKQTFPLNTSHF